MPRSYEPMRALYAVQAFEGGNWVTKQLFIIREFAAAKVARLGVGWRLHDVQREIFD